MKKEARKDGRWRSAWPTGASQVVIIDMRNSSSLKYGRESHSVDQVSESGSSQAGDQSSGPSVVGASLAAANRTRRRMTRAESRCSDEEMRWANSRLMSLGVSDEIAG